MRPLTTLVALFLLCPVLVGARPEKVLLDADIGTDVDDALALVFATRSPEIELVSVTTCGGKPEVRARLARKLLALSGNPNTPVAAGLGSSCQEPDSSFGILRAYGWGTRGKAG